MKKIYRIPKSQLIVIMVFGSIGELVTLIGTGDCYDSCWILGLLAILIPFILTFYLVGWLHYNKKNKLSPEFNQSSIKNNLSNESWDKSFRFCTNCGKKNTLDSKYCIECGELVTT